jgi:hypothetical protein
MGAVVLALTWACAIEITTTALENDLVFRPGSRDTVLTHSQQS